GTIQEDEDTVYDAGNPEPFKKFFRWAHRHGCRGKRCAVFLWGHGYGPAGLFSLEDLIDLGQARVVAPTGVTGNLKRGAVRAANGLKIKLPPAALAPVESEAQIPPQSKIAAGVPLAALSRTIPNVVNVVNTTINLKSAFAQLRELRGKPIDVLLFQC